MLPECVHVSVWSAPGGEDSFIWNTGFRSLYKGRSFSMVSWVGDGFDFFFTYATAGYLRATLAAALGVDVDDRFEKTTARMKTFSNTTFIVYVHSLQFYI